MKRTILLATLFALFNVDSFGSEWCHVSSTYFNVVWDEAKQEAEITPQFYAKAGPENLCKVLQREANTEAIEAIAKTGLLSRMNIHIKYKAGDFGDRIAIDVTDFVAVDGCPWDDDDARNYAIRCVQKSVAGMGLEQVIRIEILKDDKYGIVPIGLSNSL